eukprot:CAMPEP_0168404270 /NCGR_PEP_ID=MMETSP0228-20121227/24554_1 /TAXON_ID=133427 /ORGANISM="Protoceratium reticulatum, Strain CCCM 535 (=CCMP 1889)" /LENGTH=243 /DNA_ID=CAMNT_0008417891 /DNA_START=12 /DNA_END=743 /DNA_ORIENTATION=-
MCAVAGARPGTRSGAPEALLESQLRSIGEDVKERVEIMAWVQSGLRRLEDKFREPAAEAWVQSGLRHLEDKFREPAAEAPSCGGPPLPTELAVAMNCPRGALFRSLRGLLGRELAAECLGADEAKLTLSAVVAEGGSCVDLRARCRELPGGASEVILSHPSRTDVVGFHRARDRLVAAAAACGLPLVQADYKPRFPVLLDFDEFELDEEPPSPAREPAAAGLAPLPQDCGERLHLGPRPVAVG